MTLEGGIFTSEEMMKDKNGPMATDDPLIETDRKYHLKYGDENLRNGFGER